VLRPMSSKCFFGPTSNFSVEFGRAGGGILTRSGTNAVHGTGSWQYRSEPFESLGGHRAIRRPNSGCALILVPTGVRLLPIPEAGRGRSVLRV
jgi:hypothetical protein